MAKPQLLLGFCAVVMLGFLLTDLASSLLPSSAASGSSEMERFYVMSMVADEKPPTPVPTSKPKGLEKVAKEYGGGDYMTSFSSPLTLHSQSPAAHPESVMLLSEMRTLVPKLSAYTKALQQSKDRLESFRQRWKSACPGKNMNMKFSLCPTKYSEVPGRGAQVGFADCFDKALADGAEVAWIMQDDARLFPESSHFCDRQFRSSLASSFPSNALAVILGGYTHTKGCKHKGKDTCVAYQSCRDLQGNAAVAGEAPPPPLRLQGLKQGGGAHAFGVRGQNNLAMLSSFYRMELKQPGKKEFRPDISIYQAAQKFSSKGM